jgi:signal transduction histidine kinase
MVNAIQVMSAVEERPRDLLVFTREEKGDVLVGVEDSGVGIDANVAERVFEAFQTTKPTGMGLGLSISRSIIQAHGGCIWAEANPCSGATFYFTLKNQRAGAEAS